MPSRRSHAVLVVGAVGLAACGGGEQDEIFADPTPVSSVPSTGIVDDAGDVVLEDAAFDDERFGTDGAGEPDVDFNSELSGEVVEYEQWQRYLYVDTTATDLEWEQVESIFVIYDEFLDGTDAVWLHGEAGAPELAAAGLVEFQLAEYEESTTSEFGDLAEFEDVASSSNIETISGSVESGVVVEDCMEASITNALGIVSPDFVHQEVTFESDGGEWRATAVDIIHDGQLTSLEELGCVPAIYAEQAELVTDEFLRLEAELLAEPDVDVSALRDVTTPEFYETVVRSGTATSETIADLPGSDGAVVETLGHSSLAGPRTLYVAVCRPLSEADASTVLYGEYEVTRGLEDGFPDFGSGRDVYAVSDRSPVEQVDLCPVGSGS